MFLPGGLPVTDGKTRRPPAGDIAKSNLYSFPHPPRVRRVTLRGSSPLQMSSMSCETRRSRFRFWPCDLGKLASGSWEIIVSASLRIEREIKSYSHSNHAWYMCILLFLHTY